MDDPQGPSATYFAERNDHHRNRLVEHYLPLAERIVVSMSRKLRGWLERADLIAAGCDGLMAAIPAFDTEHGMFFGTYAS